MTGPSDSKTGAEPRTFWIPAESDREAAQELIESTLSGDMDPDLFAAALAGIAQTSSDDLFPDGSPSTDNPRVEAVVDLYNAMEDGEVEVPA